MVTAELLRETSKALEGIDNGAFEAREITGSILGLSAAELIINRDKEVPAEKAEAVRKAAKRRLDGEPMQYILMRAEFMSLPFVLNRDTLIPRADTETLAEAVIKRLRPGDEALDLCTGSGCVAVSLAYYGGDVNVTGVDISQNALAAARENARINGVETKCRFEAADIMTQTPDREYSVITANPPYIRSGIIDGLQREVSAFEPRRALDGGEDGLDFYRRIIQAYTPYLKKGGIMALEIGFDQGADVKALMMKLYKDIQIIKDLGGRDRVVTGTKL